MAPDIGILGEGSLLYKQQVPFPLTGARLNPVQLGNVVGLTLTGAPRKDENCAVLPLFGALLAATSVTSLRA